MPRRRSGQLTSWSRHRTEKYLRCPWRTGTWIASRQHPDDRDGPIPHFDNRVEQFPCLQGEET